jgi:hypothetical protein
MRATLKRLFGLGDLPASGATRRPVGQDDHAILLSISHGLTKMNGMTQAKVGLGVGNLWMAFNAKFGSAERFSNASPAVKRAYVQQIEATVPQVIEAERKNPSLNGASTAHMLMSIYFRSLMTGDTALNDAAIRIIEPLNQMGFAVRGSGTIVPGPEG